jgi:tetratricopeptide (TPR) repeat protein
VTRGDDVDAERTALVEAYINGLAADTLRARLKVATDLSEAVYLRLLTEAQAKAGVLDITDLKKEITASMRVSSRHQRRGGAALYAADAQAALQVVAGLIDAGHPDDAIVLAEHVVKRLDAALGRLDDSEGDLEEPMYAIVDLHHRACLAAKPAPRKLAARLLDVTLKSEWAWFQDAPESYGDVLGDAGLDVYRKRLERDAGPGHRARIAALRESLARASGSVDELVAVMSRDLRSPYAFHRIANVLEDAGREREALVWLERAIREFGPNADARVRQATIDAYLRDGQDHDAMTLAQRAFDDDPTADTYAVLRQVATPMGRWDQHRPDALRRLRTRPGGFDRDRTEAALAQLEEGELDAAWADAYEGGCRRDVWWRLADASRSTRPDDAVGVYRRRVDELLERGSRYGDAVTVLRTWQATLAEAERAGELEPDLDRLRAQHSRKRTFLRLLDEEQLTAG